LADRRPTAAGGVRPPLPLSEAEAVRLAQSANRHVVKLPTRAAPARWSRFAERSAFEDRFVMVFTELVRADSVSQSLPHS